MDQELKPEPAGWWELVFVSPEPEESSYLLVELGAAGIYHNQPGQFSAYFNGTKVQTESFSAAAQQLGFQSLSISEIPEQNWLKECKELWQPISLGDIIIRPVMEKPAIEVAAARSKVDPNTILLIPGLGFGTGHHATTKLAANLLGHARVKALAPKQALDIGTGSGILALISRRLLNCSVVAVDTDPSALLNAQDNLEINHETAQISLRQLEASELRGEFSLLTANLYAELLTDLSHQLKALVQKGGLMILSGILEQQLDSVLSAYRTQGLEVIELKQEGEWRAVLLG
jgi:ribosomal protein L11 methyltransferase